MENKVGVLTPISLQELGPRANARWETEPAISTVAFRFSVPLFL